MFCCKKKTGMSAGAWMGLILAIFGTMAAIYFACKWLKKHLPRFFGKCKCDGLDFPDIDLTLDEDDVHGGCCTVVSDDNDQRNRDNAVVNSENRMLNIENEDQDK